MEPNNRDGYNRRRSGFDKCTMDSPIEKCKRTDAIAITPTARSYLDITLFLSHCVAACTSHWSRFFSLLIAFLLQDAVLSSSQPFAEFPLPSHKCCNGTKYFRHFYNYIHCVICCLSNTRNVCQFSFFIFRRFGDEHTLTRRWR
jgi:hypothetical protein